VLHSVGRSGEGVREAYAAAGIPHHVTPFLRRVGDAYALADLVVARAGAMTCAELEATGTPAVLVPYPHHADRQQYENARPLVERGGAHLLDEKDLDADAVRDVIVALLEDDGRRHGMGRAMRAGRQDGAAQITDDLIRLICRRPAR
jgi:UDP-N-acetylglucosamine--N-acetylmuramyl-(pentapeptide) pyrophosphoryl-undecaprenol N-acetylglucosamine transferase